MGVLTQRQRRLLLLLMSANDWQTSAQLAERLGVSTKLVKQEVAAIRLTASSRCAIRSSTHGGYKLERLDDVLRSELTDEFDVHEGHHSITHRYARLFVYLLMQNQPVSTAELARRFFCSKASISEQLEVMRYRVGRMPHLALRVDARRGIALVGPEGERRYEAAKWLIDSFVSELPLASSSRARLEQLLEAAGPVARAALDDLARAGRISGEDVVRTGRLCALSAWRSLEGARCEEPQAGSLAPSSEAGADRARDAWFEELAARAEELIGAMEPALGYTFGPAERESIERLLADCLMPIAPDAASREQVEALAACAVRELGDHAGALILSQADTVACHLTLMLRRLRSGHGALNYQSSATMARFPLEGYVATRYLGGLGSFHTLKAEAARLALVLRSLWRPLAPALDVWLCSNESLPVVGYLADQVRHAPCDRLISVHVIPVAAFSSVPAEACCLTTDAALAAGEERARLVPLLPDADGRRAIADALEVAVRAADERATARWRRDRGCDEAFLNEVARFVARLEQGGSCTAAWQGDERAVAFTAYRTLVVVYRAVERCAVTVRAVPAGFLYRGKRYERVVEVAWPTFAMAEGPELFAVVARELITDAGHAQ